MLIKITFCPFCEAHTLVKLPTVNVTRHCPRCKCTLDKPTHKQLINMYKLLLSFKEAEMCYAAHWDKYAPLIEAMDDLLESKKNVTEETTW